MNHVEEIKHGDQLLAIIVSREFDKPGINFFTSNELSQQLAIMRHPAGKIIEPHVHNPAPREVVYTNEVLVLRQGRLRVDFYSDSQQYLFSREMKAGDMVLLVTGGHGFEVLEDVDMIEVKQGPFVGDRDKTRFQGVSSERVRLVNE
jgi:hypothetical protein